VSQAESVGRWRFVGNVCKYLSVQRFSESWSRAEQRGAASHWSTRHSELLSSGSLAGVSHSCLTEFSADLSWYLLTS
jgi:hypothetical protein